MSLDLPNAFTLSLVCYLMFTTYWHTVDLALTLLEIGLDTSKSLLQAKDYL